MVKNNNNKSCRLYSVRLPPCSSRTLTVERQQNNAFENSSEIISTVKKQWNSWYMCEHGTYQNNKSVVLTERLSDNTRIYWSMMAETRFSSISCDRVSRSEISGCKSSGKLMLLTHIAGFVCAWWTHNLAPVAHYERRIHHKGLLQ